MPVFISHQDILPLLSPHLAAVLPTFYVVISDISSVIDLPQSSNSPQISNKSLGSQACRLLLTQLQQRFVLVGELDDSQLPYYIDCEGNTINKRWYTSFSHSRLQVAVLLAEHQAIGIDIEDRAISSRIAERYFTAAEQQWLVNQDLLSQASARNMLWSLKECGIKQQGNTQQSTNLWTGLSHDISPSLAHTLILNLSEPSSRVQPINLATHLLSNNSEILPNRNDLMGYIASHQCAFVVQKTPSLDIQSS